MRALIVEDEGISRDLLSRALRARGYKIVAFADAESAQEFFSRETPELVLLDWMLPGMTGLEFCRMIRASCSDRSCFVLMITGRNSADDLEQILAAGADDYLSKPIDMGALAVRLAVAERQISLMRDRAQAAEALRGSEERYRLLAEHSTDMITRHRPDGTFEYVSPASRAVLGYNSDDLLGLRPFHFRHPEETEMLEGFMGALVRDGGAGTLECRMQHADGHFVWLEASCRAIADSQTGQTAQLVCVTRDVSERKRAVAALHESKERWRSLVENAPDIIMTVDRERRIRFINHVAAGFTEDQVLGVRAEDFAPPEYKQRLIETISQVFERGENSDEFETLTYRMDGSQGWYSVRMGPIKDEREVAAVIIICNDISERKQAQEAVAKEQRLLKQLLDFQERERQLVAFEIHDGLAAYQTGALMHLEAFASAAKLQSTVAQKDLDRGLKLLRDSVNESRRLIHGLRPPVLDELGIVPALDYLVDETRREIAEVEFIRPEEIERLNPQLESAVFRVFQEALTNIRRHSRAKRVRLELVERGDRLLLEIRDWGAGFDPSKVRDGSFGLQGIRERARLLGGTAVISSTPGEGTTIVASFPLLRASSGPS